MLKKIFPKLRATIAFIGLFIFFISGCSLLPPQAAEIIKEALQADPPQLITGKTGKAKSDGFEIWYESITPGNRPQAAILLIMGVGASAVLWPDYFYQPLVEAGYQVVRYDNRNIGLSERVAGGAKNNPYSLEDMANDALAVLDALEIEQAHLVGASMGGMIAQRLAISNADRVLSLTSISSSGYRDDPDLPKVATKFYLEVMKLWLRYGLWQSETNKLKFTVGFFRLLKGDGDYDYDENNLRKLVDITAYDIREHRGGLNFKTGRLHDTAIKASGSRYNELMAIKAPTLIIHGTADPIIPFVHALKYSQLIPEAKTLWIGGMGHDLPSIYTSKMIEAILGNIKSREN